MAENEADWIGVVPVFASQIYVSDGPDLLNLRGDNSPPKLGGVNSLKPRVLGTLRKGPQFHGSRSSREIKTQNASCQKHGCCHEVTK